MATRNGRKALYELWQLLYSSPKSSFEFFIWGIMKYIYKDCNPKYWLKLALTKKKVKHAFTWIELKQIFNLIANKLFLGAELIILHTEEESRYRVPQTFGYSSENMHFWPYVAKAKMQLKINVRPSNTFWLYQHGSEMHIFRATAKRIFKLWFWITL